MSWMDEFIPRRKFLELSFKGGLALAATPALLSQLLSCRGSEISQVKPSIDPQLLQQTIAYALRNGGDFAEVYLENRISRRIVMAMPILKKSMRLTSDELLKSPPPLPGEAKKFRLKILKKPLENRLLRSKCPFKR